MDFRRMAMMLHCILDLRREVVAVDFAHSEDEFADWPAPPLKGGLSFCTMVRMATLDKGRKAKGDNFSCKGAMEVFRFSDPAGESLTGERLFGFGLYADMEIARQVHIAMARIPEPCLAVGVIPLKRCLRTPKIVMLVAESWQIMRLVQAWAYHHGHLSDISLVGNRGVCSECVARPLITGQPHISALCSNTRFSAKWSGGDMGLGLPYDNLEPLLDGLVKTIAATETDKRKENIKQRCQEAGLELELPESRAYYLRG